MRQSPDVKKYLSALGRKGGKARLTKMTPEERREIARKGGKARQAKAKQKKANGGSYHNAPPRRAKV